MLAVIMAMLKTIALLNLFLSIEIIFSDFKYNKDSNFSNNGALLIFRKHFKTVS